MTRRVAVTGAAGFVGSSLIQKLLSDGWQVVALDSFVVGRRAQLPKESNLRIVEGDIRDPIAVSDAVQDSAVLVHLAAMHFIPWCVSNPAETLDTNIVGLQRVLDGCERASVGRVVFVSTADVYAPASQPHGEGSPVGSDNVYGQSKLFGEALVERWAKATGGSAAIARLFNVYGPGETNPHLIPDILAHLRRGDELPLGNLEPRRDYVYVDDVAAALAALAAGAADGETLNVGTGDAVSVSEVVEHLRTITGRSLTIIEDPARMRPSDRPVLRADVRKFRQHLPNLEFRGLEQGLRELVRRELAPR